MNPPVTPPRKALGRGLEALLPPRPLTGSATAAAPAPVKGEPSSSGESVELLEMGRIDPNPFQPRHHFDQAELQELADSIRVQGILQPVLVRLAGERFQLVAGERRFRAAQMLELTMIPALIRALDDERALELAIIENLQRANLNPIEQARAFQQLSQEFRLTQEQVAQKTGKDRTSVANFVRLLKLDPAVQEMIERGQLSMGHARPLVGLEAALQRTFAQQIHLQSWSVRQTEEKVAAMLRPPAVAEAPPPRDPNVVDAEEQLARALGTRVTLREGKKNRGVIEIHYAGLDEFQRIFETLTKP